MKINVDIMKLKRNISKHHLGGIIQIQEHNSFWWAAWIRQSNVEIMQCDIFEASHGLEPYAFGKRDTT